MTRKRSKFPPFVAVRRDLLRDPAWRQLSSSAKVLYIYLRSKFNYKTFSEISLTYSEAKDLMSSKTVSKAFKDLRKAGFIEQIKLGGLYGGVSTYKFIGPFKDYYYKGYAV